jgi:large repetitive protein
MSHPQLRWIRTAFAVLAALASFPLAAAAQPVPSSAFVNVPTDPFVGENVTFTLQFDNTHASAVGYGPYIDLILPATGADGAGAAADDGLTFVSATYLGAPVNAQTFTFPVGGTLPHP